MIGKTNTDLGKIDPAIALGFTIENYSGTYDGSYHGVTPFVSPAYQSSTRFRYSINGTSWRDSEYTYSAAGTYTIYVQALNSTTGNVIKTGTITINPAPVTLTADSLTTTYNRSAQSVNTYTSSVSGIRFASTVKASGSGKNAGTYNVTFSGVTLNTTKDTTGNYVVTRTVDGVITINKASANDLGLRVTGYTGNYDGSSHTVSVSVYDTDGTTYKYSTNNSTWDDNIPSRQAVGKTTVYVRAYNENYNTATASADIVINEAKAELRVSWHSGYPLTLTAPDGTSVFDLSTTGYWTGQPTQIGTYIATYPNHDPLQRSVYVGSTTSGLYTIAW